MNIEILILFAVLVAFLIILVIIINKKLAVNANNQQHLDSLVQEKNALQISLAQLQNAFEYQEQDKARIANELINAQHEVKRIYDSYEGVQFVNQELLATKARLEVENFNLKDAYGKLELTLMELKQQFMQEFTTLKTLAINELEQKAGQSLKEISKDNVVNPLQEYFKDLQQKINELALETKIINTNSKELNEQAKNLALALTKDSKKKGDFGELILTNLLESVGLTEHISYVEQSQLKLADKRLIPDVIVNLPHNRAVVIDSKNIMQRYYESVSADIESNKAVIDAIKVTFKGLGDKDYVAALDSLSERSIFAYAIMFIPNEGLFSVIVDEDQRLNGSLFREAYQRKVFIAGPSTLLVLLGMIEKAWESYQVEERAESILQLSRELADKIRLSIERLAELGNSIRKTALNYNDVIKAFDNGTASSMVGKMQKVTQLSGEKIALAELKQVNEDLRDPASL